MPDDLRLLRFGFADAETEGSENPELLLAGFFDEDGWTPRLLDGRHCLVLGPKGSGKTALAEHIRLSGIDDGGHFAMSVNLKAFPFRRFRQVSNQAEDDISRIPDTWTWLLSLMMFELYSLDDRLDGTPDFFRARNVLRKAGLLVPGQDLQGLIGHASKSTLRLQLASQIGYTLEADELPFSVGPHFAPFVRRVRDVLYEAQPSCKALLFVDGLDDVDISDPAHLRLLGSLIDSVAEFNRGYRTRGHNAKVVVLCRTDVFDRIDSPNKNKVRQDFGMDLDWYDDVWDPDRARLMRLADRKAQALNPSVVSVLGQFFPLKVRDRSTAHYLADRTRHLPRDYLRLLTYIQESSESTASPGSIANGLRRYSQAYFMPEIRDAISGFCAASVVDLGFAVLGSVARREFSLADIKSSPLIADSARDDMEGFLVSLFDASGVGLVEEQEVGRPFYAFKYRTPTRRLDPTKRMRLHPGLWPALNVAGS